MFREQFKCKCCGVEKMDTAFLIHLRDLSHILGDDWFVTSAYRCSSHNKAVGGGENSQHLYGRAVDLAAPFGKVKARIVEFAMTNGFSVGVYAGFIHIDCRPIDSQVVWNG